MIRWHWSKLLDQIVCSRAVLIVVGGGLLLLAYPTAESARLEDLPGRSLLVVLSVLGGVVGLGAAVVRSMGQPRAVVGLTLMGYSVLRGCAVFIRAFRETDAPLDLYAETGGVIIWGLLAYMGLVIWGRGHRDPDRRNGE